MAELEIALLVRLITKDAQISAKQLTQDLKEIERQAVATSKALQGTAAVVKTTAKTEVAAQGEVVKATKKKKAAVDEAAVAAKKAADETALAERKTAQEVSVYQQKAINARIKADKEREKANRKRLLDETKYGKQEASEIAKYQQEAINARIKIEKEREAINRKRIADAETARQRLKASEEKATADLQRELERRQQAMRKSLAGTSAWVDRVFESRLSGKVGPASRREITAAFTEHGLTKHERLYQTPQWIDRVFDSRLAHKDVAATEKAFSKLSPYEKRIAAEEAMKNKVAGENTASLLATENAAARQHAKEARVRARAAMDRERDSWQRLLGVTATGMTMAMTLQQVGTFAIQRIFDPAMAAAGDFEKRMKDLGFIAGDYTGKKFKELERYVREFSDSSTWSLARVQDSLYELMSAGLTFDTSKAVMPTVYGYSLFTGGRQSSGDVAKMLTSVMNKFQVSSPYLQNTSKEKAYEIIGDQLAKAVNISKFDPEEIATFVNALGMSGTRYKIPLHEMLGIGAMAKQYGLQSAQSGEFAEIFFRRITEIEKLRTRGQAGGDVVNFMRILGMDEKELARVRAEAEKAGGTKGGVRKSVTAKMMMGILAGLDLNFYDRTKPGKPFVGGIESLAMVVDRLKDYKDEMGKAVLLNTMFGEYGGQLVAMVENFSFEVERAGKTIKLYGTDALREYANQIKESTGMLAKFKQEVIGMWDSVTKMYDNAKNRAFASFGLAMIPVLTPFLKIATIFLQQAAQFMDKYPAIAAMFGSIIGVFSVLALVVGTVGQAFFGFTSALSLTYYFTHKAGTTTNVLTESLKKMKAMLFPIVNSLLVPFGLSMAKISWIIRYSLIGALAVAVAYMGNLGGFTEWADDKLRGVRLIVYALKEWYSLGEGNKRSTLAALMGLDEEGNQKYNNYLGVFLGILKVWFVLRSIGRGVWAGITDAVKSSSGAFESIWKMLQAIGGLFLDMIGKFIPGFDSKLSTFQKIEAVAYGITRGFMNVAEYLFIVVGGISDLITYLSESWFGRVLVDLGAFALGWKFIGKAIGTAVKPGDLLATVFGNLILIVGGLAHAIWAKLVPAWTALNAQVTWTLKTIYLAYMAFYAGTKIGDWLSETAYANGAERFEKMAGMPGVSAEDKKSYLATAADFKRQSKEVAENPFMSALGHALLDDKSLASTAPTNTPAELLARGSAAGNYVDTTDWEFKNIQDQMRGVGRTKEGYEYSDGSINLGDREALKRLHERTTGGNYPGIGGTTKIEAPLIIQMQIEHLTQSQLDEALEYFSKHWNGKVAEAVGG